MKSKNWKSSSPGLFVNVLLAMSLTTTFFPLQNALAAAAEGTVIDKAQYVSTSNQIQQFSSNINIAEKDQGKPLTLTFYNGPAGLQKFAWVRVYLSDEANRTAGRSSGQPSGRMIINDAAFRGGVEKVDVNLTGIIKPGSTSTIIVSGAGYKGAGVGWKLTTAGSATASSGNSGSTGGGAAAANTLQITSISPTVPRGNGSLTINGGGFSSKASDNTVYFNQSKATVNQASPTSLTVSVPSQITPGKCSIQVTVNGAKTNAFPTKVAGAPELTRTDWQAGPCGSTVTIYGKNFSEDAAENQVYFGKEKAQVVSATADTLTVKVPEFPELNGAPAYLNPTTFDLNVTVGSTAAKGHLQFISAKVGWQQ